MNKVFNAHLLVLLATFLVALSFIVSAKLSGVINPISLTLYRFVFASFILAPIIFFNQRYRSKIKKSFPKSLAISFFYSLYFLGLFKALEFTSTLNTGTLFTLTPLITAILGIFVFKQKISSFQFIIYIIGIIGTAIVIFKGNLELFLSISLNVGDMIFLLAIISMALYSISTKYFYKEDDEVLTLTFMTLIGGSLWMGIALILFDIPLEWNKIQGELLFHMAYLSIGATLITVYLYQKANVIIGPKNSMAYIYINPAFVAIILLIYENTSISQGSIIGIFISMIATILLIIYINKKENTTNSQKISISIKDS